MISWGRNGSFDNLHECSMIFPNISNITLDTYQYSITIVNIQLPRVIIKIKTNMKDGVLFIRLPSTLELLLIG